MHLLSRREAAALPPQAAPRAIGPRRIGEKAWRSQKVKPRNEPCVSQKEPPHVRSLLSKTSHRDVFDGQSAHPPGTGPSGFSAPNGCRRFSPKAPPPLVQGAALGAERGASFFLFLSQKERSKEKCSLRKSISPVATGDRGALPPRLPCKPLKRLDRNFTGLRPLLAETPGSRFRPPEG